MELRGDQITVAELLADPRSRAVFQRRFGPLDEAPMVQAAQSLTLAQLAEMAAVYLPKKTIEDTIRGTESPVRRNGPSCPCRGGNICGAARNGRRFPLFSLMW